MTHRIEFETPENIRVSYLLAGPGTRFVAWFVDSIVLWLLSFVILIVLLVVGASLDFIAEETFKSSETSGPGVPKVFLYVLGLFWVIFSLGSFFYFGLSELLLRGQTFGKRQLRIRVVSASGFSLDPGSILIRSVFRLVDQIPPLWVVPLLTEKSQRLGDLVAGTIVIAELPGDLGSTRESLANRTYAESQFHFDAAALNRARRQDVESIEKILDRYQEMPASDRDALLERVTKSLAARLQVEQPASADNRRFLEDFLAAEYRRQYRKLG